MVDMSFRLFLFNGAVFEGALQGPFEDADGVVERQLGTDEAPHPLVAEYPLEDRGLHLPFGPAVHGEVFQDRPREEFRKLGQELGFPLDLLLQVLVVEEVRQDVGGLELALIA